MPEAEEVLYNNRASFPAVPIQGTSIWSLCLKYRGSELCEWTMSPGAGTKLSKSNGILVNNQIISNTTFVSVNLPPVSQVTSDIKNCFIGLQLEHITGLWMMIQDVLMILHKYDHWLKDHPVFSGHLACCLGFSFEGKSSIFVGWRVVYDFTLQVKLLYFSDVLCRQLDKNFIILVEPWFVYL